jgi:hypothetical protein
MSVDGAPPPSGRVSSHSMLDASPSPMKNELPFANHAGWDRPVEARVVGVPPAIATFVTAGAEKSVQ